MSKARRKLLILGASGFGREVLWVIEGMSDRKRDWDVTGFLDDDVPNARRSLAGKRVHYPVLGAIHDHQPQPDEVFFCAIGGSRSRLAVAQQISERGGDFVNLIYPSALVHPTVRLGKGILISPLAGLSPNCTVGDFVVLNASAGAGHDVALEDGCFLGARCDVMGGAHLERGVFLGSHVTIREGVRVGAFATVANGATVLRHVPAAVTVFGTPAKALPV